MGKRIRIVGQEYHFIKIRRMGIQRAVCDDYKACITETSEFREIKKAIQAQEAEVWVGLFKLSWSCSSTESAQALGKSLCNSIIFSTTCPELLRSDPPFSLGYDTETQQSRSLLFKTSYSQRLGDPQTPDIFTNQS